MPILPENMARYPRDWSTAVVPRIRRRSGGVCECEGECGKHQVRCNARNGQSGAWEKPGNFIDISEFISGRWFLEEGERIIKIVLTVGHLDYTPENCDDANLRDWCQRCHNCYDAPHRRETRRGRKACGDLFR